MTEAAARLLRQASENPQDLDEVFAAVDDLADEVEWDVERMLQEPNE